MGGSRHAGVTGGVRATRSTARAPRPPVVGPADVRSLHPSDQCRDRGAGADKVYVFESGSRDLGRKKFVAHRLRIKTSDILEMVRRADTPIKERKGVLRVHVLR
mgnify:CR=1 FL=1